MQNADAKLVAMPENPFCYPFRPEPNAVTALQIGCNPV
jgi:hypothetical protein